MAVPGARKRIEEVVLTWPGVEARPHRFGGTEYRLGGRELGHVHGDHLLDVALGRKVRDELVAAGEAEPHHVLPESGWVSFRIRREEDIGRAVALLERCYGIARERQERRPGGGEAAPDGD